MIRLVVLRILVAAVVLLGLNYLAWRKTLQAGHGTWKLVTPQIAVAVLLVVASAVGIARLLAGVGDPIGTAVNLLWVAFDLAVLSVIVPALRYRGFVAARQRSGGTPSGGVAESVTAMRRAGTS